MAALVGVALVLGGGRGAQAATGDDVLLVSHDGVTFTPDLSLGVFGDLDRVVPGDRLVETVWVRNQATEAGRLRVDLTDVVSSDDALARAVVIDVGVPGTTARTPTPLIDGTDTANGCIVLNADRVLAPGETVEVTIGLSVLASLGDAPQDGRAGTQQHLAFDLRAVLSDATVPAPADDECTFVPSPPPTPTTATPAPGADGTSTSSLIATGGRTETVVLLASAALLALGIGAVASAVRRRTVRSREH